MKNELQIIIAACFKANPAIGKKCVCSSNGELCFYHAQNDKKKTYGNFKLRTIRLADVLMAIHDKFATWEKSVMVQATGHIHIVWRVENYRSKRKQGDIIEATGHGWAYDIMHKSGQWDLAKDDLSLQSKETINFLVTLLK